MATISVPDCLNTLNAADAQNAAIQLQALITSTGHQVSCKEIGVHPDSIYIYGNVHDLLIVYKNGDNYSLRFNWDSQTKPNPITNNIANVATAFSGLQNFREKLNTPKPSSDNS